jgi:hypothetical protein
MERFAKKYQKREKVDYDALVIISSYDRFEKLDRILGQLFTQPTKFNIRVIVYNDGSSDERYKTLPEKYPELMYLSSTANNGKFFYWRSINVLLKKVSRYTTHVVIQIDDDFILCDGFINEVMQVFFKSKELDNRYIAINYHNNSICNEGKKIWFGFDHGVDGGTVFDFNFLETLRFKIDPIPQHRWRKNPKLSSGVWTQVTKKINDWGLLTYKLNYSLACHDGNGDSKMNKVERNLNPLITPDFKYNADTLKINRSKYLEYSDFVKNAKLFAEKAILNELKSICEDYTELTGMNVEDIEISFITSHCVGDARPVSILSNVKIINERI